MISDEAVEAAAKAIRDALHPTQAAIIGPFMASEIQAAAALEAALPHILVEQRAQAGDIVWPDTPRPKP